MKGLPDGHHPERVAAAARMIGEQNEAAGLVIPEPYRRWYDQTPEEIAFVPEEYRDDDRPLVMPGKVKLLQLRAFDMAERARQDGKT